MDNDRGVCCATAKWTDSNAKHQLRYATLPVRTRALKFVLFATLVRRSRTAWILLSETPTSLGPTGSCLRSRVSRPVPGATIPLRKPDRFKIRQWSGNYILFLKLRPEAHRDSGPRGRQVFFTQASDVKSMIYRSN